MGKRKSKARVIKKSIASVPTQFDCLFCNHAKTVECKLNQVTNLGTIKCRVCNVSFQMEINHLHDPIDVYSEWIDETEKANRVLDEDEVEAMARHERFDEAEEDDLEKRRAARADKQRKQRGRVKEEEDDGDEEPEGESTEDY